MECWASVLVREIRHNQDGRAVSSTRHPHFTPKKIPWYLFLLEVEWTPWLVNAHIRNRSLENFQGPYRESKPERPFLWRSAFDQLHHPTYRIFTGQQCVSRVCCLHCERCLPTIFPGKQHAEAKKFGRSAVFVKENRPQGFAVFFVSQAVSLTGVESIFPLLFVADSGRRRNSCVS